MKSKRFLLLTWIIGAAALLILACGGSGSSGGVGGGDEQITFPGFTPAAQGQQVTLDENSAVTVLGMAIATQNNSIADRGGILPLSQSAGDAGADGRRSILRRATGLLAEKIQSKSRYQPSGSDAIAAGCAEGGTSELSLQWDGPEEIATLADMIADPCAVSDLRGSFTAVDCMEDGERVSGTITIDTQGSLCAPTATNISLTNFTLSGTSVRFDTRRLDLDLSSGYTPETGMQTIVEMNGQLVTTTDAGQMAAAFNNYIESCDDLGFTISGDITGPCLDGWATIDTIENVEVVPTGCPSFGRITISGAGSNPVEAEFSNDAITVGTRADLSCNELLDVVCPLP